MPYDAPKQSSGSRRAAAHENCLYNSMFYLVLDIIRDASFIVRTIP